MHPCMVYCSSSFTSIPASNDTVAFVFQRSFHPTVMFQRRSSILKCVQSICKRDVTTERPPCIAPHAMEAIGFRAKARKTSKPSAIFKVGPQRSSSKKGPCLAMASNEKWFLCSENAAFGSITISDQLTQNSSPLLCNSVRQRNELFIQQG